MAMALETRAAYTTWCRDILFEDDIVIAAGLLQKALNLHLIAIYDRIGLKELLKTPQTVEQLAAALGYIDSASITLEAMLQRLSSRYPFVEKCEAENTVKFKHNARIPKYASELEFVEQELSGLGENYNATIEFLKFGNDRFEYALRDDPEFLDRILSGRESEWKDLWFRATNVDPLQNVHGIMGAMAIDGLFESGDILEIGGGTGNGIRNLLELLDKKGELDRVNRYTFTDISQKFIMSTRHEILANYPSLKTEWRFVDLNVPINKQQIEDESVDLIYAVNAAHVAKDIVAFLKSCRETLRPGGRVVFSERIRLDPMDMAPRELTLNLSIYHRTAAYRNSTYRPMHCYLSTENWMHVLHLAGFSEAECCPELEELQDSFPDQYAAVVTAVK